VSIDTHTAVFGVIGKPITHSLSPLMHNAAFTHSGRNAVYLAFEVTDIKAAVSGIRGLGITGVSITIPHKVSVIPLLDALDPLAEKIGAVNTLVWKDGKLRGYNTDCTGAVQALAKKSRITGKQVIVLGAGGAARAVGFGIAARGGQVTIVNRTESRGKTLASALNMPFCPLSQVSGLEWDILINTTSIGMAPKPDAMPVPAQFLVKGKVVMDIVYNPVDTLLLRTAAKKGCITVDGVSMFVNQGARQFELWTGTEAPIVIMEKAVREALLNISAKC